MGVRSLRSCKDLTTGQGIKTMAPAMSVRRHAPLEWSFVRFLQAIVPTTDNTTPVSFACWRSLRYFSWTECISCQWKRSHKPQNFAHQYWIDVNSPQHFNNGLVVIWAYFDNSLIWMAFFLPGRKLFSRTEVQRVASKRQVTLEGYCKELLSLPFTITQCPHVHSFFKADTTDISPPEDSK